MTLAYGFVKSKLTGSISLKSKPHNREIQYHLHCGLHVDGGIWDVAINVGTTDSDDLLKYKLVYDFRHPLVDQLKAAAAGAKDLTDKQLLPALDFVRSDILVNTGGWRTSDVMDGSYHPDPLASLKRLLGRAYSQCLNVYVFGRFYSEGDGIHDTHMNQGSTKGFLHRWR